MHVMGSSGYKCYAIPGHLLKTQPLVRRHRQRRRAHQRAHRQDARLHRLTLAGKNLMGCTSNRQRMHTLGLSQSIAEINAKLRPELTVIDAMRILVRNGPSGGSLNDVAVKNTVDRLQGLGRRRHLGLPALRCQQPAAVPVHQGGGGHGSRHHEPLVPHHPQRLSSRDRG